MIHATNDELMHLWRELILPRVALKSPSAASFSALTNIYPQTACAPLHPAHILMRQQDDVYIVSAIKTRIQFFLLFFCKIISTCLFHESWLRQRHTNTQKMTSKYTI